MGCDIHPFLELKIAGKWVYVGALSSGRNYDLFAMISGVRGEPPEDCPYFPMPSSVPKDCSSEVKDIFEDEGYYHSLTIATYELIFAFNRKFSNTYYVKDWEKIIHNCIKGGVASDGRVIIGYDS